MPFFLIPIVAGAAAYGAATQDEAGQYSAGEGERTIDAYQIWAQITSGPGTGSIDDGQHAASTLKGSYDQRVRTIEDLSRDMDAAWQGSAGDAANSGAHPLKVWMEDSRDKLKDSDKYLGEQRGAFTTVHSKVEPVPEKPPESGFLNDVAPWETDTDRAIKDYNTKAQANVDAFNAYFQASNDNAGGMPTYSEVDGEFGKVEVSDDGSGDDDDADRPGGPGDRNGYSPGQIPGGGGGGYQPGTIPGGGGYTPGRVPGGGGGGYGIPDGGGYDIPGGGGDNRPGAHVPGAGGYPLGQIPEWDDSTSASGYKPGSIPAADLSRGGGGGGFTPGVAGSIGGGGGFGPGGTGSVGGFGPGGSGGFGPGSGSVTPGAGSGTGAGGQGGAGRGGAVGGGAGARGMGGMGGMMGGGGRGGQGGGDEEHQNKFLVEEDPNSLFGSDELTAPPVIGE